MFEIVFCYTLPPAYAAKSITETQLNKNNTYETKENVE